MMQMGVHTHTDRWACTIKPPRRSSYKIGEKNHFYPTSLNQGYFRNAIYCVVEVNTLQNDLNMDLPHGMSIFYV